MIIRIFLTLTTALLAVSVVAQPLSCNDLTTEHLVNPAGIDAQRPVLGWQLKSGERDVRQVAYEILVASSKEIILSGRGDVWQSGKVLADESQNVRYGGGPLASRQRCFWAVRVWDNKGKVSPFSEVASWEMGLLSPDDWNSKWISAVPASDTTAPVLPAPHFRKEFDTKDGLVHARLYVSGLGYYEASLNGQRIGDHVLDPGVTRYDKRIRYVIYDVKDLIRADASNAIGIVLGNGWLNQHSRTAWNFDQAPWRQAPCLTLQLELVYADGTSQVIVSDRSWKWSFGPIAFNDIHNGETFDSRLQLGRWNEPGYAADTWQNAYEVPGPGGKLDAQLMPPIRVVQTRTPTLVNRKGNVLIYNVGQNMAGRTKLRVTGPSGAEVRIRHGERLTQEGDLDMRELSRFITGGVQTDLLILNGETTTWAPAFTYHGFQYIELSLSSPDIDVEMVEAEVLHTDFKTRGTFTCSDTLLNRIHENFKWSYLTNFHSYPTDCPHREKMGWTGDGQLVAESGLFNFDAVSAYRKWLDDFVDEQGTSGRIPGIVPSSGWGYEYGKGPERPLGYGPQWEGALVIIPWELFKYTGDTTIIQDYYEAMKAYVGHLTAHSTGHLIAFGIDDHKQLKNNTQSDILSAGYYFRLASLLARMGAIVGRADDAKRYRELAAGIREAFNAKYFHAHNGMYGAGGQAALAEALYFGLVPDDARARVTHNLLQSIADNGGALETGVVGTKFVIHALMETGNDSLLHALATRTEFPGWGYWIVNGATTLYQNWDMSQSLNHVMFGTIGDYFYQGLGGLRPDPDKPGFRHMRIHPLVNNNLNTAAISCETPYGQVSVRWRRTDKGLVLDCQVPPNTTADIVLPAASSEKVTEQGRKLRRIPGVGRYERVAEGMKVTVGSGAYHFLVDEFAH